MLAWVLAGLARRILYGGLPQGNLVSPTYDSQEFERAWLQAAVKAIPDSLILVDEDGNYLKVAGGDQVLRKSLPNRVEGKNVRDVFDAQAADRIVAWLGKVVESTEPQTHAFSFPVEGRSLQYESRGMPTDLVVNGKRVAVVVGRDVSRQVEDERSIRSLSLYDRMTGLPNRRLFFDRLRHAEFAGARDGEFSAVLIVDLDGLGRINELSGHSVGDELIRLTGLRLRDIFDEGVTVARLGGDEFAILLEGLSASKDAAAARAEKFAERIIGGFALPYDISGVDSGALPRSAMAGRHVFIGGCVGITLFNAPHGVNEIMMQASSAVRSAKQVSQNAIRFFDPDWQKLIGCRVKMEQELHKSFANHELKLLYQPKFDKNDHIFGVEALLRWEHPTYGTLSPDVFKDAAEYAGLFLQIEKWVARSVCEQLASWGDDHVMSDIAVSLNVSTAELYNDDFAGELISILNDTGADPKKLTIELVESMLLSDIEAARAHMRRLRDVGVKFALDDFGTGYSSLSYMQQLAIDEVKIDKTFVDGLPNDKGSLAIIRAIIALGKTFDFAITAEGVESEDQRAVLLDVGCQHFQGFLCSEALDPANLRMLVKANKISGQPAWAERI